MQSAPAVNLPIDTNTLEIAVAIIVAVALAGSLALIVGGVAKRLFAGLERDTFRPTIARGTVRLVRLITFVIALMVLAFPALDLVGVQTPVGLRSAQLGEWAAENGIRIAALLLLAFAVVRLLNALISRAERDLATGTDLDALERRKRTQTVASLARRALTGLIWTTAALMILRELDVDITPVLTGAGILGLAIGFGAQTLVRDVISGFFLIIEDQVRVGDVASVNGTGGLVEQINMRTIVLRDEEGVVHVFPNGEIKTLANRTKDFSYYVISLGVEYSEDTDRVIAAIKETADEVKADPAFGIYMLQPLEVLGVDDLGASQVTVKVRVKTAPLKQWDVGRELRRRLKKTLEARGIRVPSPQLTVTLKREKQNP
jgi:small-conductance mechanosensitive channel